MEESRKNKASANYVLGTCGACVAFSALPGGERGECKLRPELNEIPASLERCSKYLERGTLKRWEKPKAAGAPRRRQARMEKVVQSRPQPKYGSTIDLGGDDMDTSALKALFEDVLREEGVLGYIPVGQKWEGGTVVLKPGNDSMQPKEIPLETFFKKIVMVRERLRFLEQRINNHDKLEEADKLELQQYLTRAYGSLTTFNVLFADKGDHFVGAKGNS